MGKAITRPSRAKAKTRRPPDAKDWRPPVASICAALGIATFLLYLPAAFHAFVDYDDQQYVIDNAHVTSGLTAGNLLWAFRTGYAANWHPLTWISLMADCQCFGLAPGPEHAVNALLHAAATAVLFLALWRMTGAVWRPAIVAALFGWHPIHVESVAWIAERKDVLSGLFWMLAIAAYAGYARRPDWRRYAAVVLFFALGLLSKPMVVTLPAILLLLDYWPLRRLDSLRSLPRLALEKAPLFGLAAGACLITVMVQSRGGAISGAGASPLAGRLADALDAVCFYVGKIFWPIDLMVPYVPGARPGAMLIAAAAVLFLLFTGASLALRRSHLYWPAGWLWFLITLLPVIGLVRVGVQFAADRYMYLPSIGLFILLAWGGTELLERFHAPMSVRAGVPALLLCACAALACRQIGYWQNSETLFLHSVTTDPDNLEAVDCLASTYATDPDPRLRNPAKAIALSSICVQATDRKNPYYLDTLGSAYAAAHQFRAAIDAAVEAQRLPGTAQAEIDELTGDIQLYRQGRAIHERR